MLTLGSEKTFKTLSKIVFILYLLMLIWIIVFKANIMLDGLYSHYKKMSSLSVLQRFLNHLIPFAEYASPKYLSFEAIRDEVLNVVVFIPFGLYLSYFCDKNKFLKTVVIVLLSTTILEMFQLFSLLGVFATKDIVTNTLGGIIGYLIYKLIYKESRVFLFNVVSIVIIVIAVPLSIYAVINTINNINSYLDIILRRI